MVAVDDMIVLDKGCLSKLFLGLANFSLLTNLVLFINLGWL